MLKQGGLVKMRRVTEVFYNDPLCRRPQQGYQRANDWVIGRDPHSMSCEDTVALAKASAEILCVGNVCRRALSSCLFYFI